MYKNCYLILRTHYREFENFKVERSSDYYYLAFFNLFFIADCAAANLATGNLNGEHET